MVLPRFSIARMTALIAILAVDCGLTRAFLRIGGLGGFSAVGLALSLSLIGWLLSQGSFQRFCAGFSVTAYCAVSLLCLNAFVLPAVHKRIYDDFIGLILNRLPSGLSAFVATRVNTYTSQTSFGPTLQFLLVMELLISLPVLAVAVIGGLVALAVRRHPRPNSSPNLA